MQACCHQNLSPMNSYPPSKMCSSDIKQPWSQQHPVPKVRAHISQQRQEPIVHVCHVMYWSHNLPTSKTRYTRLTQPLRLFIIVEEKETKHISPVTHLGAYIIISTAKYHVYIKLQAFLFCDHLNTQLAKAENWNFICLTRKYLKGNFPIIPQ